jgi:hypothetical protein
METANIMYMHKCTFSNNNTIDKPGYILYGYFDHFQAVDFSIIIDNYRYYR